MAKQRIKLADIQALKDRLEALMAEGDSSLKRLKSAADEYRDASTYIENSRATANTTLSEIDEARSAAVAKAEEIKAQLAASLAVAPKIDEFAAKVDGLAEQNDKKAATLAGLVSDAQALKSTVEELLPGATSAGLAAAFKERKDFFAKPIRFWSIAFIVSICLLVIFSFVSPQDWSFEPLEPANVWRQLLGRLPVLGPLVWFAIYSSHRHGQALRLEEEYAHKEAISKSFEGYKAQLLQIEESDRDRPSTEQLITRTLEAIALNPGHIYDKKREQITPADSVRDWIHAVRRPRSEQQKANSNVGDTTN